MTTSISTTGRKPLRLNLGEDSRRDVLDGGWWPQSRDLEVELADLLAHFSAPEPPVVHVRYSVADWTAPPQQLRIAGGRVTTEALPPDDTNLIVLTTAEADGRVLRLLVVPPELTPDQGDEALLAAASRGNAHSAADLLRTVTEHPDVDPRDHWS